MGHTMKVLYVPRNMSSKLYYRYTGITKITKKDVEVANNKRPLFFKRLKPKKKFKFNNSKTNTSQKTQQNLNKETYKYTMLKVTRVEYMKTWLTFPFW